MCAVPTPRPGILEIAPYVGGDASVPGVAEPARLASNEGALGPSPRAMEAYRELAGQLARYPDGESAGLKAALAERFGVEPARVVCGAGSDELITLLIRSFAGPGDEILYSAHGFLMYPITARTVGATPIAAPETDLTADVDALLRHVTPRTRMVFLANPNNPTGTYIGRDALDRLRAGLPDDVLLVLDAAYAEFVDRNDYTDGIDMVRSHDNVVMLRTFSKIFGLGAVRLGWGYMAEGVADILNRVRSPFNVGAPAQAAGVAALEDGAWTEKARAHNDHWRGWFVDAVSGLGFSVVPSVTNFLLVSFAGGKTTAEAARQELRRHGVLVRQMGAYGLPDYLRVSIGSEREMTLARDAFADLAGKAG